jgi:hypothetical protein
MVFEHQREPVGKSDASASALSRQRQSIERMTSEADRVLLTYLESQLAGFDPDLQSWSGVGVGRGGRSTLFFETEDPRALLKLAELVGHYQMLPNCLAIGPIVLAAGPGDSIGAGFRGGMSGTLGCLVKCNQTGARMALTNDHVVGATASQSPNADVWSPGAANGGGAHAKIGTFARGSTISFTGSANRTDAALVDLMNPSAHRTALPHGATPSQVAATVNFGDWGYKDGVATGHTSGQLVYIASFKIPYAGQQALFVGQMVFDGNPFADRGDSGALVVNAAGEAQGLLFAAAPRIGFGFVNPMVDVLNEMKASL